MRLVIVAMVVVTSGAAFLGTARLLKLSEASDILKALQGMVSRRDGQGLENAVELPTATGVSP